MLEQERSETFAIRGCAFLAELEALPKRICGIGGFYYLWCRVSTITPNVAMKIEEFHPCNGRKALCALAFSACQRGNAHLYLYRKPTSPEVEGQPLFLFLNSNKEDRTPLPSAMGR